MSSIGRAFRVSTFGESHGKGVGCIIEGVPAGFHISQADIQYHLNRRKPGQSSITTPRQEADTVEILSGVENDTTLGTPIGLLIRNQDTNPSDYSQFRSIPRPGHADFTYAQRYGITSKSGGGRSSARETAARVAAGAVALKFLKDHLGVEIVSWVDSVGDVRVNTYGEWSREDVETRGVIEVGEQAYRNVDGKYFIDGVETDVSDFQVIEVVNMRCPEPEAAAKMVNLVQNVRKDGDSIGGVLKCQVRNVPVGLGEPCFDKAEALLAHAMLSIPATKGFEIGSGFEGTRLRGSQHNDPFHHTEQGLRPATNNAGGTLGGLTSGANIEFRVAFKPVSTISQPQSTSNWSGEECTLEARGRHDPCVVPRAVPIVEAMTALVLMDLYCLKEAQVVIRNS